MARIEEIPSGRACRALGPALEQTEGTVEARHERQDAARVQHHQPRPGVEEITRDLDETTPTQGSLQDAAGACAKRRRMTDTDTLVVPRAHDDTARGGHAQNTHAHVHGTDTDTNEVGTAANVVTETGLNEGEAHSYDYFFKECYFTGYTATVENDPETADSYAETVPSGEPDAYIHPAITNTLTQIEVAMNQALADAAVPDWDILHSGNVLGEPSHGPLAFQQAEFNVIMVGAEAGTEEEPIVIDDD